MNRPYSANYAIGFMFVTGIIMFFQGMCGIAYPEIFDYFELSQNTLYVIAVLSVIMFILSVLLFLGFPIAHKIAILVLAIGIISDFDGADVYSMEFLDLVLIALSVASIILLLYKPCREFYKGWDARMQFND